MGKSFFLGIFFLVFSTAFAQKLMRNEGETRVIIIGDSIGKEDEGVSSESFAKLLGKVAEQKPDIVFFSGNLINEWEQSTSVESMLELSAHLDQFSRLAKTYLGDKVKIYPLIGNHAFVNSRVVQIFKEHFRIQDVAPIEPYQWAYSVITDHVQFVVMASGLFERKYRSYRQELKSMPLLDWLEKELASDAGSVHYRFVIGHMPAFSTRSTEGIYTGLDADIERRDAFWKVLKENYALGYFSSHDPIYDRSNRDGVWQIISGGAGIPGEGKEASPIFQHYILITIPDDQSKNPILESIDIEGNVWDTFEIIPTDQPVHQLRISRSFDTLDFTVKLVVEPRKHKEPDRGIEESINKSDDCS